MDVEGLIKVFEENKSVSGRILNELKKAHIIRLLKFINKMERIRDNPFDEIWVVSSTNLDAESGVFSVEVLTPELSLHGDSFKNYQAVLMGIDKGSFVKAFDEDTVLIKFIISDIFSDNFGESLFTVDDLTEFDLIDDIDFKG